MKKTLAWMLAIPARHRRTLAIVYDLSIAVLAFAGAVFLRYGMSLPPGLPARMPSLLLVVALIQGSVFWGMGLYRGLWRFASLHDLNAILKAVTIAVPASALALFLVSRLHLIPRSVFVIDWFVLFFALGGARFAYRAWKDGVWRPHAVEGARTLIIGAGSGGAQLLQEIQRNPQVGIRVLGLIDDDARKQGRTLMGVRVLGTADDLPELVTAMEIEQILIAIPTASARQMRRLVDVASATPAKVRTLPNLAELIKHPSELSSLREVRLDDLLGREKVELDTAAIAHLVQGHCVLVSGAGGSIGSELCRQLLTFQPERLLLVDRSEFALYRLELELAALSLSFPCHFLAADAGNAAQMEAVFALYRPELVLHAAAYKHVPLMESNVANALHNNLGGTLTLARLAGSHGCANFVLISTDKAVNPTNVMGASKRLAEMICQALQREYEKTHFTIVRFGNVLGSQGSVIPRFMEQIQAGGPVTVTHPEITRYFMSIAEAAQLVLQAATLGHGGEIFLLDMGEPVKILDLAETLIRLTGKRPGTDVEIVFSGLRPGEKLYEELLVAEECSLATPHPKIFVARARLAPPGVVPAVENLLRLCFTLPESELRAWVQSWVPEFLPAGEPEPDKVSACEPVQSRVLD